ncbi:U4/U6.U5 small nuclear ribonucleoprotein 27 kDa protein [Tribolium castaneum]|uniref:U4/U6.U5 small nuclear ribonucleoprotein 27 kDa protein n=1 Tax=Tribolium castaneum TaxID=7070 RepID=D6WCF0_TRICA|nr:PREDICTED: U4/U6.U5 small nuclear ribonucleoprotein 27 kDa protein [Tribolium castaneum]EEZ99018.1 U4/U6.U5 small nuclear ribonucleoprotein 27 kDa protein-like Protein [Tribolium castaneum]|eukprot:XP_971068.1 PREDICTED: U4/U6.U5 small nuclear ribonucleoprotein 27 kDa protein [Tribolium castaneum]
MGRRSRSKSPYGSRRRDRERDRDRERERERHRRKRSKERSRDRERRHEREPRRRYSRSLTRSRSRSVEKKSKPLQPERPVVTAADLEGKSADEQEMMKLMGFCSFDTTKGKKVEGNDVGGVHVILKRKYRQYMNRKGGFNRPLDFVA